MRHPPRHRRKSTPTVAECLAELWRRACEHDRINPAAKFIAFSDTNKYAAFYNQAVLQVQHATRGFDAPR